MPRLRYARLHSLALAALGALVLSGCSALNPLQGVEPGPDTAWSRPGARPAATPAARAPERPAPATPSSPRTAPRSHEAAGAVTVAPGPSVRAGAPVLAGAAALSQHLRAEGADWIGTPYRYGGESRNGMDCSGFTRTLMQEALGVRLSRSTATQVEEGTAVDKDDLLPGDLVFFRRRGTRHVGVYLGDGEFIHASSSNGVIVSRLDEGYYERNYWTARRVLDDPQRFVGSGPGGLAGSPGDSPGDPPARRTSAAAEPPRSATATSRSAW